MDTKQHLETQHFEIPPNHNLLGVEMYGEDIGLERGIRFVVF